MLSEPELQHSNARRTFRRHQGLLFKSVYLKTVNDKFPKSEVFICCPYISEEPLTWKPHLELVASIWPNSNGLPPNEISVMEARRTFVGGKKILSCHLVANANHAPFYNMYLYGVQSQIFSRVSELNPV